MSDTNKILWHIAELYANPTKTLTYDQAVKIYYEKLEAHFEEYDKAFEDYYTDDVLEAVDKCWRFDSDKTRPKLAKIEAYLRSEQKVEKVEKPRQSQNSGKIADYDPAQLMRRDIELKRNRHLLPVYEKAVRYIAEDLLVREIPAEQWRRLDLAGRCKLAWEKGLFSQLDDVLVLICRKYWGKDYQYPSESELESHKMDTYVSKAKSFIASHYRTDEARQARNDNSLDLESVFGF